MDELLALDALQLRLKAVSDEELDPVSLANQRDVIRGADDIGGIEAVLETDAHHVAGSGILQAREDVRFLDVAFAARENAGEKDRDHEGFIKLRHTCAPLQEEEKPYTLQRETSPWKRDVPEKINMLSAACQ